MAWFVRSFIPGRNGALVVGIKERKDKIPLGE